MFSHVITVSCINLGIRARITRTSPYMGRKRLIPGSGGQNDQKFVIYAIDYPTYPKLGNQASRNQYENWRNISGFLFFKNPEL